MSKWRTFLISLFILVIMIIQLNQLTVTTLKYFPIDDTALFLTTSTILSIDVKENNQPSLSWRIDSEHQTESFLAHDVGLLYQNGKLKGLQSKWSQKDSHLEQMISLVPEKNNYYQAISYHYLELHPSENKINSNYQLSTDQLFIVEDNRKQSDYFKIPESPLEKKLAEALEDSTQIYLQERWTDLINNYEIDRHQYIEIPLVNLDEYQDKPLPGLNINDSKRVIAQLWEGLYENYIIPNKQQKNHGADMPLILLDKNKDHLFVLFNDGENVKQKLIQKLSVD